MKKIKKIVPIIISAGMLLPTTSYASDLTLEEAVTTALENNINLKTAVENENVAKSNLDIAKGQSGFSVSVSEGVSANKVEGQSSSVSNSFSISSNYSLYDGNKNNNNIKSNEMGIDIARLETEQTANDLVKDVSIAYYNALEARDTVKVNQEVVKNYTAHLDNVNKLFAGGVKAKIDVLRTEVELADAKQKLTKAQVSYDNKIDILKTYMNAYSKDELTLTSPIVMIPLNNDVDYYLKQSKENRTDLKIDNYKIKQAELGVESARAGYKPNVNWSVSTNHSHSFSDSNKGNNFGFSSGVNLNWNIFDGGVTKAKVEENESLLKTAKLNLEKDMLNSSLKIRTAYLNLKEANSRFDSASKAIAKAEEDCRIAIIKYTAGEGLLIDMIDAQTALMNARLNLCNAQYDYARNQVELQNAVGDLYNNYLNKVENI